MRAFVDEDGGIDIENLERAMLVATHIGLRQTNVTLELPEWDAIQKRDRLIGVSITGVMDAYDLLHAKRGMQWSKFLELLNHLNKTVNVGAIHYAHEMRVPDPLLSTAI